MTEPPKLHCCSSKTLPALPASNSMVASWGALAHKQWIGGGPVLFQGNEHPAAEAGDGSSTPSSHTPSSTLHHF